MARMPAMIYQKENCSFRFWTFGSGSGGSVFKEILTAARRSFAASPSLSATAHAVQARGPARRAAGALARIQAICPAFRAVSRALMAAEWRVTIRNDHIPGGDREQAMRGELRIEFGGSDVARVAVGTRPLTLGRAPDVDVQI